MNIILVLLITSLLSFAPISELRGAIIFGISNNVSPIVIFLLCVAINLLVAPFVFFVMDKLYLLLFKKPLKEHGFIKKFHKKRLRTRIEKFGSIALTIFVMIPLPITGAWTGSIVAWLMGFSSKKAIPAISVGVVIAGLIVTLIAMGAISFLNFLI